VASWELEFIGRDHFVVALYRPLGMLLERRSRALGFPGYRAVRHYDDAGRLVAEEHTGESPAALESHYDEHGRLARVDQLNARGLKPAVEFYACHDDGTRTHTQCIDPPLRDQNLGVLLENSLHFRRRPHPYNPRQSQSACQKGLLRYR
jgi:YD repeat-containing protein